MRRAIEPEGATCEGLGFVPGNVAGIATPAAGRLLVGSLRAANAFRSDKIRIFRDFY
jgi:hypothetical protein